MPPHDPSPLLVSSRCKLQACRAGMERTPPLWYAPCRLPAGNMARARSRRVRRLLYLRHSPRASQCLQASSKQKDVIVQPEYHFGRRKAGTPHLARQDNETENLNAGYWRRRSVSVSQSGPPKLGLGLGPGSRLCPSHI